MDSPAISIVIPVHDDAYGLDTTLLAISSMETSIPCEVIVCDDCGPPAIQEITNKYGYRHIRLQSHQGSYAARNAGIRASEAPYLAFLDADQTLSPYWLDAGLRALKQSDYAGGRIIVQSDDPSDLWKSYDERTAFNVARYIELLKFAPTANLFVRREVAEALGGFNSNLKSGGDRDFGRRAHLAGYRQSFAPDAVTYHHARGKRAQLKKRVRTGTGMAEVRVVAWKQHWILVALHGFYRITFIPLEWIFSVSAKKEPAMPTRMKLTFAGIKARLEFTHHIAYIIRAIQLRRVK